MRIGPALMLATFLAVAGCLGPGPDDDGEVDAERAPGFHFGDRVVMGREPNISSESFIAVSPDGQHILSCLHGFFIEPSPMFASTDGGRTFARLPAGPEFGVGGDCEVAIDGAGTWYFLDSLGWAATLHATEDQGTTWRHTYVTAIPTNGFADRPWIEAFGDVLVLTYMPLSGIGGEPGGVGITRSTDGGRTWSTPQTLSFDATTLVVEGHPFASPDGTIRIAIMHYGRALQEEAVPCRLAFAVSRDEGATWTEEPVAQYACVDTWGVWATAAADGDGSLYWVYSVANGTLTDVLAITSADDGATWSEPFTILAGLGQTTNAWIDGRSDGSVDLGIVAARGDEPSHLLLLRLEAGVDGLVADVADLGENEYIEFLGIDHDASDRAHVAFTQLEQLLYVTESESA